MINNRQGGRRRGRGGGPRTPNQGPNPGNNRQDNRSRGNAAQLLEKYKSLARDAQMQGDRVQSEYFLQFAEHYYRLLNENRARFEEQSRQRGDYYSDEDEDQDEQVNAADGDERDDRYERDERPERAERQDRPERQERPERQFRAEGERPERPRREFQPERNGEFRQERRPREDREERRPRAGNGANEPESERIALDVLPPAISVVESDSEPKAPRRRTRRPRTDEGDAEIAPAA
ncbi:MAG: hypothetical protein QOH81_748 [Sphingomonadales bacterium]|nr:hypothetical protein [Sphingomonadales bacterium]